MPRAIYVIAIFCACVCAPAAHAVSPYSYHVACSLKIGARPAAVCRAAQKKAAFFSSSAADAVYSVCVKFPNRKKLCAGNLQAPQGETIVNRINSNVIGTHVVSWIVGGTRIGRVKFEVVR